MLIRKTPVFDPFFTLVSKTIFSRKSRQPKIFRFSMSPNTSF
jgi:hypothetical protein